MARKSNTPKIDRRTAARIKVTRKDAEMLFKAINQAEPGSDARIDILEYIDEVAESAPLRQDYSADRRRFVKLFLEGWPESDRFTRANVGEIIQRIRTGQTVEEIHEHLEIERRKIRDERAEKELNAPEPKDWLSAEWRYWKLRRIHHALNYGTDAETQAALREFKALVNDLVRDENFYHVSFAYTLTAMLISARQDIACFVGAPRQARRKPAYFKKGVKANG